MQILFRDNEDIKSVFMDNNSTLNDLKEKIEDITFLPHDIMYITHNSQILKMGYVKDQLEENDLVEVMLELKGGMRAKWRKKRMRRMRRLRRKMRQRAR